MRVPSWLLCSGGLRPSHSFCLILRRSETAATEVTTVVRARCSAAAIPGSETRGIRRRACSSLRLCSRSRMRSCKSMEMPLAAGSLGFSAAASTISVSAISSCGAGNCSCGKSWTCRRVPSHALMMNVSASISRKRNKFLDRPESGRAVITLACYFHGANPSRLRNMGAFIQPAWSAEIESMRGHLRIAAQSASCSNESGPNTVLSSCFRRYQD